MKTSLKYFIKSKVKSVTYDALYKHLGITKTKFTRMLNNPAEANKELVLRIARLLQVAPTLLVDQYKMGYNNLTLSDYEQLKAA